MYGTFLLATRPNYDSYKTIVNSEYMLTVCERHNVAALSVNSAMNERYPNVTVALLLLLATATSPAPVSVVCSRITLQSKSSIPNTEPTIPKQASIPLQLEAAISESSRCAPIIVDVPYFPRIILCGLLWPFVNALVRQMLSPHHTRTDTSQYNCDRSHAQLP